MRNYNKHLAVIGLMMVAIGIIAYFGSTTDVSASMFSEVKDGVEHSLDISSGGGLILAGAVLLAVVLSTALADVPLPGTSAVIVLTVIILTAVGWLDIFAMTIIILLIGGMWAMKMADIFGGGQH